jgi:hypothetical protein
MALWLDSRAPPPGLSMEHPGLDAGRFMALGFTVHRRTEPVTLFCL